jgi:hypothetical protein
LHLQPRATGDNGCHKTILKRRNPGLDMNRG